MDIWSILISELYPILPQYIGNLSCILICPLVVVFVSESIAKSHYILLTKYSNKRLNKLKRTGKLNIYPGLEYNGKDISH